VLFGAFNIADFVPWLGWIDPQGLNLRLVQARAALDSFIDKIIEEHVEKKRSGKSCDDESDMVDELLNFYSENPKLNEESNDLHTSITLTKDNIKAIIMVLYFYALLNHLLYFYIREIYIEKFLKLFF